MPFLLPGARLWSREACVAAWEGQAAEQREVLDAERAFGDRFPGGLKEAMARRFGTSATCRVG